MRIAFNLIIGTIISIGLLSAAEPQKKPKPKHVIIAYVGGFRGLADIDSLDPGKLATSIMHLST